MLPAIPAVRREIEAGLLDASAPPPAAPRPAPLRRVRQMLRLWLHGHAARLERALRP